MQSRANFQPPPFDEYDLNLVISQAQFPIIIYFMAAAGTDEYCIWWFDPRFILRSFAATCCTVRLCEGTISTGKFQCFGPLCCTVTRDCRLRSPFVCRGDMSRVRAWLVYFFSLKGWPPWVRGLLPTIAQFGSFWWGRVGRVNLLWFICIFLWGFIGGLVRWTDVAVFTWLWRGRIMSLNSWGCSFIIGLALRSSELLTIGFEGFHGPQFEGYLHLQMADNLSCFCSSSTSSSHCAP